MKQTARPANERSRRRKTWLIIGATFVFVLGTVEIVYWAHRRADEGRQAESDERAEKIIAQAAGTKNYGAAREQIEAGHFDFDTLKRAVRTEIRRQTMLRVNGYFDLKTEQQRRDYLDKVINEATAYQKLAAGTSQPAWVPQPKATPRGKGAFVAWVVQQPAPTRARLAEFGAAFNARLAQRGLPRMDGPFD